MCNSANCSHIDNLDDSIDDLFGGNPTPRALTEQDYSFVQSNLSSSLYTEKCKFCTNGTFYSWSGRALGPCRRCKGKSVMTFKTSPEQRAATKKSYEARKQTREEEANNAADQFARENEAEYQWLVKNAPSFEFANSLLSALRRYGRLTDGQLGAVRKILAKNAAREEERLAAKQQSNAAAPSVNVQPIEIAFTHAQSKGIKRPKMRLDTFKFSMAPAHGNNAGSIYVTENDVYLGKITAGKFYRVRFNCSDDQEVRIVAVCANPSAAATAYGQRTGQCSICGRELTKGESIDRAIGPICAEKYGF